MKILVAEDDANILQGVKELLENEGHTVVAASDGRRALEAYAKKKPDAVILDIMMPGLDGYAVCREIRKSDAALPVLFLSAKSEEVDKVVGLELGADDFVAKPFGKRELMARLNAVCRRAAAPRLNKAPEKFVMKDLEVDPAALRASRGGRAIELGARDAKILELLYRQRGRVVTREEMSEKCWGLDFQGTTRSLDQHIAQLRKKIEKNPGAPEIILTVHGAGYRFEG